IFQSSPSRRKVVVTRRTKGATSSRSPTSPPTSPPRAGRRGATHIARERVDAGDLPVAEPPRGEVERLGDTLPPPDGRAERIGQRHVLAMGVEGLHRLRAPSGELGRAPSGSARR